MTVKLSQGQQRQVKCNLADCLGGWGGVERKQIQTKLPLYDGVGLINDYGKELIGGSV